MSPSLLHCKTSKDGFIQTRLYGIKFPRGTKHYNEWRSDYMGAISHERAWACYVAAKVVLECVS